MQTISSRLLKTTLPPIAVVLMLVFGAFEYYTYRDMENALVEKAEQALDVHGSALTVQLWNMDETAYKHTLDSIVLDMDIIGVELLDPSGKQLASAGVTAKPQSGADRHMHLSRDIHFEHRGVKEHLGKMSIHVSRAQFETLLVRQAWLHAFLFMAVLFLVGLIVTARSRAILKKPLARLTDSIKTATQSGKNEPVEWDREDELGVLISSYNEMMDARHTAEQGLRDMVETLEERVAERTAELEQANRDLKALALFDGLTELLNRRSFDDYLSHEWSRLAREKQPLSLVMCDIDHFKQFNDTCGHPEGDHENEVIACAGCRAGIPVLAGAGAQTPPRYFRSCERRGRTCRSRR